MNWLYYILEANLYLSIFYIGYCLVLNKETHYALNRAYLIGSCMLAFVLPFLQLGVLKHPAPVLQQPVVTTINYIPVQQQQLVYAIAPKPTVNFTWQDGVLYLYLLGAIILLAIFVFKLYRLYVLSRSKSTGTGDYKLIEIDGQDTAFSFFNYLFINADVAAAETIIRHELVHIKQKHSADILFVELLKIVCWFNPFIYLLQISLKAVHEYIADEKTAGNTDISDYSTFLVNNAYGLGGSSITHSFFNYNLLKKRIIMLHQKRSGGLARLKYLVAVPICAGLLCVSTLAFSKDYGWVDIAPAGIKPVASTNSDETNHHTGPHRIDKANTSPQVPEPNRELSVRQNGKSIITDKFSAQRADGSIRNYTAYNISNKDVSDLAKRGIDVRVLYDVKIEEDTAKHSAPPPPPPAPPQPKATYTGKGYKFREDGYLIHNKTNYRVIITEKDGTEKSYFRNSATAAEINMLKNKYGYTFPTMNIYPKLPPLPPVPPVDKRPPPPPPVPPVGKSSDAPAPINANVNANIDYSSFYKQISHIIKYPTAAKDSNKTGRVMAVFMVTKDYKIDKISVAPGNSQILNDETIRALQNCDASALKPGMNYVLPLYFALIDKDGSYVRSYVKSTDAPHYSIGGNRDLTKLLDEVVITAYK